MYGVHMPDECMWEIYKPVAGVINRVVQQCSRHDEIFPLKIFWLLVCEPIDNLENQFNNRTWKAPNASSGLAPINHEAPSRIGFDDFDERAVHECQHENMMDGKDSILQVLVLFEHFDIQPQNLCFTS